MTLGKPTITSAASWDIRLARRWQLACGVARASEARLGDVAMAISSTGLDDLSRSPVHPVNVKASSRAMILNFGQSIPI